MSNVKVTSENGSIWRKWDLHLHTPNTKLNNQFDQDGEEDTWQTYCKKIEESDVSAFGITDYFSCENYFIFIEQFKQYYPQSTKVFFPNIEFRLEVAVNKEAEEVNIHVIFSNEVTEQNILDFLAHLETNHSTEAGVKINCRDLRPYQFVSATVNHEKIIECLKKVFGRKKPYMVVCAVNNAGIRPVSNSPRKLAITDEIDKICDAFFGGSQNVKHYLNPERLETDEVAKSKPIISGCDAHAFREMDEWLGKHVTRELQSGKKEVLKSITWIKADLTFEGLKQILYEPEYRVIISESEPRKPTRRIESIKFNFPNDTVIKRKNSKEQMDFCLKKLNQPIYFSDYFTCIIGGRGTGKSTIINLLAEKLNEDTEFFNRSSLIMKGEEYDIESDSSNYIEITGTNEIEFVSQGKIEKLAEGNELTNLVFYERIMQIEGRFLELEHEFDRIIDLVNDNIDILFDLISSSQTKRSKTKELVTSQNIVDSINDPRYSEITTKIKELNERLVSIEQSKTGYERLLNDLSSTILDYPPITNPNEIDERVQKIVEKVKSIEEIGEDESGLNIKLKEFAKINEEIEKLQEELVSENQKLVTFFEEKGTNEETIKDSQKASESVSRIKRELQIIDDADRGLKSRYTENRKEIDQLESLYIKYEKLIKSNLESINEKLKVNDENILDIKFEYEFDTSKYQDRLFDEFYHDFKEYHISGTSESRVREVLFLIPPDRELLKMDYRTFLEKLNMAITGDRYRRDNNYVKIITNVFSRKGNFLIYTHLIEKHIYNLSEFIKIKGSYGDTDLQSSSFGQRCTAVIVTLLMTGVKPLVIDEPEAHLDNKLIADYLVDLVKDKQFDRQIIFASHNSNFVINGDAGLIHILEIPNTGVHTNKTSTTIENINNREQLLKLEGGKEAFLSRESKYGI